MENNNYTTTYIDAARVIREQIGNLLDSISRAKVMSTSRTLVELFNSTKDKSDTSSRASIYLGDAANDLQKAGELLKQAQEILEARWEKMGNL